MKEESHDLQKTGIPDATGFAPGTRAGERRAGSGDGQARIEAPVGRSPFTAERKESGEGRSTSIADLPLDEEKDAFAAELAEIDALLNRSAA
ncbi:hypothetical protein GUK34_10260 [Rhizobium leguminosarum]|uniref:hypothetical protein n=1 Tax=Rhizobium ruizarguesonis TaxID=2081791 RepID=UPI0013BB2707|nr:hypothetical protein [Rhizobium ruizarguesonis]NEI05255.1 hypothetical protein [Rhizobium ruizarguesonis]